MLAILIVDSELEAVVVVGTGAMQIEVRQYTEPLSHMH